MGAEVKIVGMEKVNVKIKNNLGLYAVRTVVQKNGSEMQKKAQKKAPVGTPQSTGIPNYKGGTLKKSIGLEITNGGLTATVEPTADYAAYVELGTRKMNAKPYLKPAFDEQKEKFKSDMQKLVR